MARGLAATGSKRRKFEEIADHIELAIVSGHLKVGDRLPSERELMERFGTGRGSVREALFVLQRKGLIHTSSGAVPRVGEPKADMMVRELSGIARLLLNRPEGARELQEARALFEIGLARQAAKMASAERLEAIRAALAANEDAPDAPTFVATDIAFHSAIAEACENSTYLAVNTAFGEWLHGQRTVSAAAGSTRENVIVQHRAIFEAIARRDHVAAEAAMDDHLATVAHFYWKGRAGSA
ncbi:FCD domain-containing protein [Acuticoccus mangrovi]|uniref:FCD domain-containing protein n=1 Tax=Acuticoccus mangrovi TaxID=2796142 RepID=A0A934IFQ2_9HYPH|nr:FCD domain-containing protein [Acuticoccus mangrovi]MBJ3775804.1 FCD domain-containing protein [Acuticoccus mangrovi]